MEPRLAQFKASFVRISTDDGMPVGAGFLVSDDQRVLTCAHVVAGALRISADATEKPEGAVHLDFPFLGATTHTAQLEHWLPPSGPSTNPSGDIAVLNLATALPGNARPVSLAATEDLFEHEFLAYGYPQGYDAGVWAYGELRDQLGNGWLQVEDTKGTGRRIEQGFSGGPVGDQETGRIVGMVVASTRDRVEKVGFVIPTEVLARACPELIHFTKQRREPMVSNPTHRQGKSRESSETESPNSRRSEFLQKLDRLENDSQQEREFLRQKYSSFREELTTLNLDITACRRLINLDPKTALLYVDDLERQLAGFGEQARSLKAEYRLFREKGLYIESSVTNQTVNGERSIGDLSRMIQGLKSRPS